MNTFLVDASKSTPRRLLGTSLVAASLLWAVASAEAQQIPSPYEFVDETQSANAFVGYIWTADGPGGINIGSAPIFGARYNVRLGGPATGEVSLGLGPTQRPVVRPVAGATHEYIDDVNALLGIVEAGVKLALTGPRTWNNLMPYLVGTGGVAADLLRSSDLEAELGIESGERFRFGPTLAVGLGAGTDWFPTPGFSVRVEVRDHIWRISPPDGLDELEAEWTNNIGFSVGAAYHF